MIDTPSIFVKEWLFFTILFADDISSMKLDITALFSENLYDRSANPWLIEAECDIYASVE